MAQVLVVDDDQAIRETLRLLLEDDGYEVIEAEDGGAALDLLRASDRPMVVLLDLMMPRMSGYQALSAVVADPCVLQSHAYIMVTASPQARMLTVGRLGNRLTVPCVEKPFDLDDLLDAVERAAAKISLAALASARAGAEPAGAEPAEYEACG